MKRQSTTETTKNPELLRPAPAFRIGFVGHRTNRLTGADPGQLSKVIKLILSKAGEEVARIFHSDSAWYSGDTPEIKVISSLAEGSDRLFAEEAMSLGYSLNCPMPFTQEEFEKDFVPGTALETDSLKRFREILNKAENSVGLTRFELIGDRSQEAQSYRSCGQMVLNQSDLLMVVWDGISQMRVGGTEEMLRKALRLHIPVVWIDARLPHGWMVLEEAGQIPLADHEGRQVPAACEDSTRLARVISRTLTPPGTLGSANAEEKSSFRRLSDFYAERLPGWNPAIVWKVFGIVMGKGKWSSLFKLFRPIKPEVTTQTIQGFEDRDLAGSRVVQSAFVQCDRLSAYYGDYYRSGYILTFLLASLAVGLALFPLVAGWVTHENKIGESVMVTAELVTLLGILLIVFRSRSRRWHGRWLDYRLAAEWLRRLKLLAPLGLAIPMVETRGHKKSYEHPSSTWMAWYIKALERNLGLPDARIDPVYLNKYLSALLGLTADQQSYHSNNSRKNHLIEKRLHRLGIILVGLTIAACTTHLIPLFFEEMKLSPGIAHFLTFLCGFLPALGAALAGINNQGEFKTLAKTSESMQQEYAELSAELHALQSTLQTPDEKSAILLFKSIREVAFRISNLMIEELSDWRITYHNRPLELPV